MGINLGAIAGLLARQNPQMQQIIQQVQGMAQAGNDPTMILSSLENQYPTLKNNGMWKNLKGKSAAEIEQYAGNIAGTLGLFK